MIEGRGGGGVIRPQIPEKKLWSRLCSREDEIRSYSRERRKPDEMHGGNLKINTHTALQVIGVHDEGKFWPDTSGNQCGGSNCNTL